MIHIVVWLVRNAGIAGVVTSVSFLGKHTINSHTLTFVVCLFTHTHKINSDVIDHHPVGIYFQFSVEHCYFVLFLLVLLIFFSSLLLPFRFEKSLCIYLKIENESPCRWVRNGCSTSYTYGSTGDRFICWRVLCDCPAHGIFVVAR